MPEINSFQTAKKIITGWGSLGRLVDEIKNFNATRVLVVTDPFIAKMGLVDKVRNLLEPLNIKVGCFDGVEPEPRIQIVQECIAAVAEGDYQVLIGLGGGSSMDITKCASVLQANGGEIKNYFGVNLIPKPGLPMIMVPTTAGTGSEVTAIAILSDTDAELKKGIVSPYMLPDVAIVDPELTVSMPPKVTAATGMDALTHAIEAYISVNSTPITDSLALKAIKLIAGSLRAAVANGENIKARSNMAMASLLAGIAFANAGVGAVHALAYPLGGKYHIPHGVSNTLMLPYVMEYNLISNLPKFVDIAKAMGEEVDQLSVREAANKALESMKALAVDIGVPLRLREVNIPEEALSILADGAITQTRLLTNNPRKLTQDEILEIYKKAF